MTNEQRAKRNRVLAEACGHRVCNEKYDGSLFVEFQFKGDGTSGVDYDDFDPTRSLDDVAEVEKKLAVRPNVMWVRKLVERRLVYVCSVCVEKVLEGGVLTSCSVPVAEAPTEALARSAACEAAIDGGARCQ